MVPSIGWSAQKMYEYKCYWISAFYLVKKKMICIYALLCLEFDKLFINKWKVLVPGAQKASPLYYTVFSSFETNTITSYIGSIFKVLHIFALISMWLSNKTCFDFQPESQETMTTVKVCKQVVDKMR